MCIAHVERGEYSESCLQTMCIAHVEAKVLQPNNTNALRAFLRWFSSVNVATCIAHYYYNIATPCLIIFPVCHSSQSRILPLEASICSVELVTVLMRLIQTELFFSTPSTCQRVHTRSLACFHTV